MKLSLVFSNKMHGELLKSRGPPLITAAVVPTDPEKGEMEPLLQQEARYYQNIPEVAINFKVPSSAPPPQSDPESWQPTLTKDKQRVEGANWFGIFLAFLSGGFFTLSSAGVKALKNVDPMELLVLRSLLQIAAMLPIAISKGENILGPKGQRGLLQLQVRRMLPVPTSKTSSLFVQYLLRTALMSSRLSSNIFSSYAQGIVGGSTLVLLFFTFRRLPLGDATTIIFSSPVFVLIMSFLFLREPCGFFRTLIVCLLLTGVILISKPPFIFQVRVAQSLA